VAIERNWQKRINSDPGILGGKPVITGTRVPVEVIVGALAGGMGVPEVARDYLIAEDDVRAALAYVTALVAKEKMRAAPSR